MTYHISRRANADIEAICDYIAKDNPDAADRLDARIHNTIEMLSQFPKIGAFQAGCIRYALSVLDGRGIRYCV